MIRAIGETRISVQGPVVAQVQAACPATTARCSPRIRQRRGTRRPRAHCHRAAGARAGVDREQRWEAAGRTLAQLRAIRPAAPEVAGFDATLREARARWQAEIDRRQVGERANQLADPVSLRIRQGKLLDAANEVVCLQ